MWEGEILYFNSRKERSTDAERFTDLVARRENSHLMAPHL